MENIIKNRIKETLKFIETETNTEREDNLLRGEIAFLEHLLDYAPSSLLLKKDKTQTFEEFKQEFFICIDGEYVNKISGEYWCENQITDRYKKMYN